jgi:hypothetical protein
MVLLRSFILARCDLPICGIGLGTEDGNIAFVGGEKKN